MLVSSPHIDGGSRNKYCLKGRGGNDVQHKKEKKTNKDISWDIGYNNSSRRFRPLGSRVMAYQM